MSCLERSRRQLSLAALLFLLLSLSAPSHAQEDETTPDPVPPPSAATVSNGDFEAGSLAGWTAFTSTSSGGWAAYSGTTMPRSGLSTFAPPQGNFAAAADMTAQGNYVLYQDVALPAGQRHTLSFILFFNNRNYYNNSPFRNPTGTALNLSSDQHYRVDVTTTTASPTSVASGDVLANIFQTRPGDLQSLAPALVTFDLTPFAGQTVRLRFAVAVCCYYFNPGFDDVRITSSLHIAGRVADASGRGVPSVRLDLSGTETRATYTDAFGNYAFDGLTEGGDYTVTPSRAGFAFTPPSQPFAAVNTNRRADFVAAPNAPLVPPSAGELIISRFRTIGVRGSLDQFVELYNNSGRDLVVADATPPASGQAGWALVGGDQPATARFVIPAGTIIPARSPFLIAYTDYLSGYSLGAAAGQDGGFLNSPLAAGRGIAVFRTANTGNFNLATRLDSVGFGNETNALFFEGTKLAPAGGIITSTEHVFMRRLASSTPQDTDDNAADFVLVAPSGAALGGVQSQLGSSAPNGLTHPREANGQTSATLLDCGVSSGTAPNRVTDSTANGINTRTLKIRRTVVNNTGAPVVKLRFRVIRITTLGTPIEASNQADVRAVTSSDEVVSVVAPCVGVGTSRTPLGLMLDVPPAQSSGGGLNSTVRAGTVTLRHPLQPGQSLDVNFWLAVVTSGHFRYFVNVEAQN